jgi:hypothetical protein
MEGKRFVETERTYRLSSEVVRHGIDQSSSLSVHLSPLSQRCKHRERGACGKNLPQAGKGGILAGYCSPEPGSAPSFRAVTLVSDRTGRSVAVNVETLGNVRVLTVGSDPWNPRL